MSRLSIVIPVLGSPQAMEDTLVSVLENRPADCQIVVVFNQSYDDPYDLKDEVTFVQAPRKARLATMLNLALAESRAPLVHVLACGVEVSPGWAEAALASFDDPCVAAVAPLIVHKNNAQRVVAAGLTYAARGAVRRLGNGKSSAGALGWQDDLDGPDILAAFYCRAALDAVGQFAAEVGDQYVAADVALRLRQAGFRCVLQPQCWTFVDPGTIGASAGLRSAWAAESFFWRWAPAEGWTRSLVGHAFLLMGQCLACLVRPSKIVELPGRLLGVLSIASHRRHWRAMGAMSQVDLAAENSPSATAAARQSRSA